MTAFVEILTIIAQYLRELQRMRFRLDGLLDARWEETAAAIADAPAAREAPTRHYCLTPIADTLCPGRWEVLADGSQDDAQRTAFDQTPGA